MLSDNIIPQVLPKSKRALVLGAGGFIGNHLVNRLKSEKYEVIAVDLKFPEYSKTKADTFLIGDLSDRNFVTNIFDDHSPFSEIYQLAADMGGAGYIFTGENDASVMHNSALINLLVLEALATRINSDYKPKVFFSSSACVYPENIQLSNSIELIDLEESKAYPANPDSEYGWEKLFSERLYFAFSRNYGLNVRVARFHNIYGPFGTWQGGKEKAPAAICRKIASAKRQKIKTVQIWGDGLQTRSFLFISDCVEAIRRFMEQEDFQGPLNIGSDEMVSIRELVEIAANAANYPVTIESIPGPTGVRGRNSNNELARQVLNWNYQINLNQGIQETYAWIETQEAQFHSIKEK